MVPETKITDVYLSALVLSDVVTGVPTVHQDWYHEGYQMRNTMGVSDEVLLYIYVSIYSF